MADTDVRYRRPMPRSLRLLWLQCCVCDSLVTVTFSKSVGGDQCFHEKVGGRFGFGIYTGASSATVGFHDVLGAVGLVSERVSGVRRCGRRCVCIRATGILAVSCR